jgi:hypothetical protein
MDFKLVESYLKRLQAALGNEEMFRSLYSEPKADKRVEKAEAIQIASRSVTPMAPSTTRTKALQKVLWRHERLLEGRAASASIGGKGEVRIRVHK